MLWNLLKIGLNMIRRVSSGKSQDIWTENFVCIAKKQVKKNNEKDLETEAN